MKCIRKEINTLKEVTPIRCYTLKEVIDPGKLLYQRDYKKEVK